MTDTAATPSDFVVPDGYVRREWNKGFGNQIGPVYERMRDDGDYSLAFPVMEHHTNGMNVCHGGMLMAFADLSFGRVISVQRLQYWVTVRLLTDFISSARVGDWVEGKASIDGEEDGFVSATGRLWVGDRTILTGSGLFKCMGARPKGI